MVTPTSKPVFLSKSRFQSGRQCHKRLWLEIHRRELLQWDSSAEAHFTEGTSFGKLARELLGGGVLVDAEHFEAEKALAQTRELLAEPIDTVTTLFEPAFEHDGVRVRADAFQRVGRVERLIEVKSSTSVKDEYLWDCAIQTWVARGAGRPVREVRLGHVNNAFVYTTEGDYRGLLTLADVTVQVEDLLPAVPGIVATLKHVVAGEEPKIATGEHCTTPYACPFWDHCRSAEPPAPEHPIDDLPRAKRIVSDLREAGYEDLRDVPVEHLPNALHRRIATAVQTGAVFVSSELDAELDAITYPRHYLDFETIAFAVPRWIGTRPYQQIPFQFSCHIEHPDGSLEHREHLDLTGESPLEAFALTLVDALGESGPILVWNRGFEWGRIKELAQMVPSCAEALLGLEGRLIDLLPIYRAHYYHPDMHGSWSIKAVLPTIAPDLDYGELEIGDGGAAQEGYLRAISPETMPEEKASLRQHLLTYCGRDTFAMVRLVHRQLEGNPQKQISSMERHGGKPKMRAVLHKKSKRHLRYLGQSNGESGRVTAEDEITSDVFEGLHLLSAQESFQFWRSLLGVPFSEIFFPAGWPEETNWKDDDWKFWPGRKADQRIEPDMMITYRWPGHPERCILVEMKWGARPDHEQLSDQWLRYLSVEERTNTVHVLIARDVYSVRDIDRRDSGTVGDDDHFQAHTWFKVRAMIGEFQHATGGLGRWARLVDRYLGELGVRRFDGVPSPSFPVPSICLDGYLWKGKSYWVNANISDDSVAQVTHLNTAERVFWSSHRFRGLVNIPFETTIPALASNSSYLFDIKGRQP